MNRLFLKFLPAVLLSIAIATALIYIVITLLFGSPAEQDANRQAAPQIFLLEQYIDKAPSDEWLSRLNKVREVSQVKFDLLPLTEARNKLSASQYGRLMQGKVVIDASQKSFFRRVDLDGKRYVGSEDDVIFAQDLPIDFWLTIKVEALRYIIIALALLVPIALWSRSHWRDVQTLSSVANAFGAGEFSTHASLSRSASMYPLAQQLHQMAARIEQLIASKKTLLHSVSHELRTPLARLAFGLELLRKNDMLDTTQNKRIDAMQLDVTELNALVDELLDAARLEQENQVSNKNKTYIDTHALIQHCLQRQSPQIPSKHITVAVTDTCKTLWCDEKILARAINNLLKNAMVYANKKITITVTTEPLDHVRLMVEDDGIGIAEEERNKVFDTFYRIDRSRNKESGGFGLGLAIAKQAIQWHDGTIHVEPSPCGGARFIIILPTKPNDKMI